MKKVLSPGSGNSRWRKLLIKAITIGFPLILLLMLEGLLRLVSYGNNLNLFISNPRKGYEHYYILNPEVGRKYFLKFGHEAPPNDIFLKRKPEGTFRVFVMGSSTVAGFPFERNLMFSRILHQRLADAFPQRQIEVVNTAITAVNSFTLKDFSRQIVRYSPDAILVYAGHNEFYGAFGVGSNESMSRSRALTELHLFFMDFRFYQLFRNISSSFSGKGGAGSPDQVHGTLMKRIASSESIPFGSPDYELAMKRYRQNMGDLLRMFADRQVPVFLSEVVSNVKDLKPFSSVSAGNQDEALMEFNRAGVDYLNGDYESARLHYNRAKDLDGVRFRASEQVNRIIRELAAEHHACPVPMVDCFQAHSDNGIIGKRLITEHVHPTIEGIFIMADAFFTEIVQTGLPGEVLEDKIHPFGYYKQNWGYTALDSLLGHHRIANLMNHWPFVPFDARLPDYRLSYRPVSVTDSIAFSAFRDPDRYLDEMRLTLAREYASMGNHQAAYREYEALLRTNPYIASNYRDAATSLIFLGDLPLAYSYFVRSLAYEPSFYALYRIGEILLIKGDYLQARKRFEEAFSLAADNNEKLKTLGRLYICCHCADQEKDAEAIAQQLERYGAGEHLSIPPKQYTYLQYVPFQTAPQVESARQLITEGLIPEAVTLLETSLKTYDSHIARRILGEACLLAGDTLKALNHLTRVHDEFSFDPVFESTLNKIKSFNAKSSP